MGSDMVQASSYLGRKCKLQIYRLLLSRKWIQFGARDSYFKFGAALTGRKSGSILIM